MASDTRNPGSANTPKVTPTIRGDDGNGGIRFGSRMDLLQEKGRRPGGQVWGRRSLRETVSKRPTFKPGAALVFRHTEPTKRKRPPVRRPPWRGARSAAY